jgi:DNA-binding transcriptional regulator LsrR (DeoR family)
MAKVVSIMKAVTFAHMTLRRSYEHEWRRKMDREEERLLYKVAKLYYEENLTQKEIAEETGIYRTTVGRMLKKAYKEGIVKIKVQSSFSEQFQLEEKIASHFAMKEVLIVSEDQAHKNVAKACNNLLDRIIKDEDVVGLSWGESIGNLTSISTDLTPKNITCVPLVGGAGKMDVDFHVNAIVYEFAKAFKGTHQFIDAVAIYESIETAEEIIHSDFMHKVIELWDKLTVAIVGIGTPKSSSNMVWSGFLGETEQIELQEHHAIGDILSRFYTVNGEVIDSPIANRTIAIRLEKLRNLRYSIGVAYTKEKAEAIVGAMRGKFINTLVTTEETALEINKIIEENGGF